MIHKCMLSACIYELIIICPPKTTYVIMGIIVFLTKISLFWPKYLFFDQNFCRRKFYSCNSSRPTGGLGKNKWGIFGEASVHVEYFTKLYQEMSTFYFFNLHLELKQISTSSMIKINDPNGYEAWQLINPHDAHSDELIMASN